MRPELVAWVLVHGTGLLLNLAGVLLAIPLGARPGFPTRVAVVRSLQHVGYACIHASSLVTGTAIIAALPPAQVWSYALLQGALFAGLGGGNLYLTFRDRAAT